MTPILRSLAAVACVSLATWAVLYAANVTNVLALTLITTAANLGAVYWILTTKWQPRTPVPEDGESRRRWHARSELLASMSSDIRAPLRNILETIELAMEGDLSYPQRKQLASVHASAESLQQLLNDILDLADVDLGRLTLRPVDFEFRPMLEQVLAPYIQEAKSRERTLSYLVQNRVPNALRGDVERLQDILQNLVAFVTSTTGGGDVVVRVSVNTREADEVELLFNIAGTNPSADGAHLDSIVAGLQSNSRKTDGAYARQPTPTDLGLAVSAQLIELIGGRFWEIKDEGQPPNVCFTARFGIAKSNVVPTIERTQLGLIPDLPVLVVHADNEDGRQLEDMLSRWQTHPTCVTSSEKMWEELESARNSGMPYGLVIIDAQLPEEDGFEICTKLKANQIYSATPAIMLTDADHPEEALKATRAGASSHVLKPVKSSRLSSAIVMAVLGRGRFWKMRKDLGAAEMYVRSLIPPPTQEVLCIDWRYIPAADLAGDSLGFHWIDDDHCAFYVLDVCGHGLDAALLSVSVLNVLKSMTLPDTDFRRPDQVLSQLNNKFPMEAHGDRCFTAWYGVYDRKQSTLRWAGGGHPPALLLSDGDEEVVARELGSHGPLIGMLADMEFPSDQCDVGGGARLYVYSDGAFEIETPDGRQSRFEDFVEFMRMPRRGDSSMLDVLWQRARELRGNDILDDDFTILEVRF